MFVVVTYDVATADEGGPKRLRRVARACQDYGIRVQKSVFECQVGRKEWEELRARLLEEIDREKDSLRFYFLDERAVTSIEHHGKNEILDIAEPLVL
jgi:CRISPR-associated protein Cas2